MNGSYGSRRDKQRRRTIRFNLLVVFFMLFTSIYSTIGSIDPVAAAQPDCPEGQELNDQDECVDIVVDDLIDDGTEDSTDDGTEDSTDDGTVDSTDDGAEDSTDDGTEDSTDDGTEDTADAGLYEDPDYFGWVDIYKYECESGYTGSNYVDDCTSPMSDVPFQYSGSNGSSGSGSTDGGGYVGFNDLDPDSYSVSEDVPDGYGTPIVYCAFGDDQSSFGNFSEWNVSGGNSIDLDFNDYAYAQCWWFNIQDYEAGTVELYKYYCDEYYDPSSYDFDWYTDNCTDWHDGATFSVGDESMSVSGSDSVTFEDVPYGQTTLREEHEEGYGSPVVYCWLVGEDSSLAEPVLYPVSSSGEWQYDYQEGYRLICYVFNQPDGHDITIYKYYCDEYYDAASYDYEWYSDECTEWHDGATFTVAGESKSISGSDNVWYDDVAYGDVAFMEEHEEGYGTPVVYCLEVNGVEGEATAYPVSDTGEWTVPYEEGYRLICYVYNQPDTGHDVTIYKYYCEEAYDAASYDYEWYSNECNDWHDGATFSIGDDSKAISGSDNVWWDDVAAGGVTFREEHEEGYGTPVVYCWLVGEDTSLAEPVLYDVNESGEWTYEYQDGYQLICYVFNQPDNGHDVTIYKYYCDEYYDVASYDYEWYSNECTDWHDGATFSIGDESKSIDGTDNVWFDNIDYGDVTIREEHESGYGIPVVYCWQTGEDTTLAAPTAYTVSDTGEWTAPYQDGYKLVCYVYNLPGDHDITIYKYYCEPGYEVASYDYQWYVDNCTDWHDGATFYVGDEEKPISGTDNVWFDDVAYGDLTIREEHESGYGIPVVYCWQTGEDTSFATPTTYEVSETGEWTAPYYEGYKLVCYVYNIPDDHDITIYKYYCDPGYEVASYDYEWYAENCTDWHDGATFYIGDEAKAISGSDNVWYDDVAYGDVTIREEHESGYGIPVVYCWQVGEDTTLATPTTYTVSETGEWTTPYQDGYKLVCYVYNIPTDNDITVYKYICPYGYYYEGASLDYLYEYCEVIEIPIPFSLYDGETLLETQTTGDLLTGGVVYNGYDAAGGYRIQEEVPEGYDQPRVFCRVVTGSDEEILFGSSDLTEYDLVDGWLELGSEAAASATYDYGWYCEWFNFEGAADDNTVTIYKWECPIFGPDVEWEDTQEWLLENCTQAMEGVDYSLDDLAGPRSLATDATGKVEWTDVNNGPVTITETIPNGYGQPSVFCGWTSFYNGAVYDAFPQKVDAPNGVWSTNVDVPNSSVFCDWFNFQDTPGEITVYKYWCPEGYDLYEYGADPYTDCNDTAEGVEFSMSGDMRTTDADGVVYWGDLAPGDYNVVETYPEGTAYSFVLNCYGGRFAGIQPYPLQMDPDLSVKVVSGDSIYCYWYNVPERNDGWITVYKYWCSTKTYKSEVDCQIYEKGMVFELYTYEGDDYLDEKTTSQVGKITWGGLDDGNYVIKEQDYDWCAIDISDKGPDDSISVKSGQETVVKVYNCDPGKEVPEPKRPQGKVPTKYPNTGIDPTTLTLPATGVGPIQGGDSMTFALFAVATVLTLAAGGFVLRRRRTASDPAATADARRDPVTTRRVLVGAAVGVFAAPFVVSAQGDGEIVSSDDAEGTPAGTPDVPQCREDATPDADDPDEDPDCIRGEVPKHIAIESIGVDADIEIQEIIADEMQDPSGPELVTWYKETTRLGERGNGVYAGHLNYWGFPEAVFFAIKQLQPGAEIVITGDNDEEFIYTVDWVENQPGQDDPDPAVLGLTEEESITLITCGGEWDTTIAEYNERTAVRASRKQAEPEAD